MDATKGRSDAASHRLILDRWEGDLAVVELDDGRVLDLPGWVLPPGAAEGDVISVSGEVGADGARRVQLVIDREETERARAEVQATLERLRRRDPGGDIEL